MTRARRPIPMTPALLVVTGCLITIPGCYREVVSAKGLGAAAYQNDIGKGGNYSGLSFDDATREPRRAYSAPGVGGRISGRGDISDAK
ncbi:MAG: hypothetical protein ACKVZJ_05380 [Phycisphaerales bacterium]